MWRTVIASGAVLVAVNCALSQATSPSSAARIERDLDRRMSDMRALDDYARRQSAKDQKSRTVNLDAPTLDAKTKDLIREKRLISTREVVSYLDFLKLPDTGVFKLYPHLDCVSKNVVRLSDDCEKFVPETSDFSFRTNAYTHPLYHDIGYENDELFSRAFFVDAILVSLGDLPIQKVDMTTSAVRYLAARQSAKNVADAKKNVAEVGLGILDGTYKYSGHVPVAENTTFLIRSTAYNVANSFGRISLDTPLIELRFLSLERDKRDDILVAFRIVHKDDLGGLTIVWKQLDKHPAPKLMFTKDQKFEDIREDK